MLRNRSLLRAVTAFAVIGGVSFVSIAAFSADMPTKAPPVGCIQAVDGINGKVAGLGGSFADKGIYGGLGSFSMPLGCEFGVQIDGSAGSFDSRFLGSAAGHLFWRDPAKGLLGVYGSYTFWDQAGGVRANHIGPEGELYYGRWTLQGVGGVEFGNTTSATIGDIIQTYEIKTRFFDQVNVGYYLQDNFKLFIGHRYLGGKHALAFGGEYGIPMSHGVMTALFAEGRFGEGDFHGVWGGLRFYFGQKDKTLIRRHREDDPNDWGGGFGNGINNGGSTTPTPTPTQNCCPVSGTNNLILKPGTQLAELQVASPVCICTQ
jgi:hypothetical protein